MHRLQYSKQDIALLRGYLEKLDDVDMPYSDHNAVYRLYDILYSQRYSKLARDAHHLDLYEKIKERVAIHVLQVIYHLPLKLIPLYVNHGKVIIRTIAQWRLALGR